MLISEVNVKVNREEYRL